MLAVTKLSVILEHVTELGRLTTREVRAKYYSASLVTEYHTIVHQELSAIRVIVQDLRSDVLGFDAEDEME